MSKNEERGFEMRKIKIRAYGCALPEKIIYFKNQKRYKIGAKETQLSLIEKAVNNALNNVWDKFEIK